VTAAIALVLAVLAITIVLFVTELLRVDVIALLIMLSLPWLGLVSGAEAFSGLASNAVVSIIAIMILGYGVDRSGIMNRLIRPITRLAGHSESRLIGLVSTVVGGISAFMQNVGAAALFLPALLRIARRTAIPASRLLMPMGFAAILGGTLSMVGSSPLIILNDLMQAGGEARFGLFTVTPIGAVLLFSGIAYFVLFGRYVLPAKTPPDTVLGRQQELITSWQLPATIHELVIPAGSPLVGKTREEVRLTQDYRLNLLALADEDEVLYAPWRHAHFAAGQVLAMLGQREDAERFAHDFRLQLRKRLERFEDLQSPASAGFAEVIIAPRAKIAGKTLREIALRKTYEVEPLVLLSQGKVERSDFSDQPLMAGDALIVHGSWARMKGLNTTGDFVLATPIAVEDIDESKGLLAGVCFVAAIGLALAGAQLALALFSGALAMVLLRVVGIDEAYRAVDWRTVFLLAGLIPLGLAMEKSGAAGYVAHHMMQMLQGSPAAIVLLAIAGLSTLFSLFMSNVAATVLLVPLAMKLGALSGLDPRALALLVGVSASNSFLLPTHQVNALLMGPAGYRNADYLRAGGIMTAIFLVVAVGTVYLFYL
jgi:di/tricarboxylate transporter